MLQNIQDAVKKRAIITFILVHIGAALSAIALIRSTTLNGWDVDSFLFATGLLLLYGGFLLGVFFIVAPLLPWLKRAQQAEHWSERLIRELPLFLEQLPKIIAAIQGIVETWNESKHESKPAPKHKAESKSIEPSK
jgi:hypothetical protein